MDKTPVEAERERLRAKGYSDEDIRQILIQLEIESAKQQAAGAPPVQMPMSGVLGNASAAVSYGRAAIFGIRGDIRNLFNTTAPALERAMSGGILAFKLIVVAVVCFAIYQEWQRHVIYETEVAKEQAAGAHTQRCWQTNHIWNVPGTAAYEQWLKDCRDFVQGSARPKPTYPEGKDAYDTVPVADVLDEFKEIDPKFKEIAHADGDATFRLCVYRQALRLMGDYGYGDHKEDAVEEAAPDCLPDGSRKANPHFPIPASRN